MSKQYIFLIWMLLLVTVGFVASAQARAEDAYCRLDSTPWLGCPAEGTKSADHTCGCAATGVSATRVRGHVQPTGDEEMFLISSESTKLALGISSIAGPVAAFVPRTLIVHRDQADTAERQQMLQIYDFFHFHNFGAPQSEPPPRRQSWLPLAPARAFMPAKDIPPPDVGAYGVVALKAKPTPVSRERLGIACQAFLASLPPQKSLPPSIPLAQQMITVWPIDNPQAIGPDDSNCNVLLEHYDLYGGLAAVQDAVLQGETLAGRGPFLIGWSPSNSRRVPNAVVLVIDMSAFDTQASFDEAFLFWQHKVVEDPALWRSGFWVEGVRLAVRDFVDHYGNDILKAIKIGGE
jgi:hypothetical protein